MKERPSYREEASKALNRRDELQRLKDRLSSGKNPTRGPFHKLIYALAQSICAIHPTFEKLSTGAKIRRKPQTIGTMVQSLVEEKIFPLSF